MVVDYQCLKVACDMAGFIPAATRLIVTLGVSIAFGPFSG